MCRITALRVETLSLHIRRSLVCQSVSQLYHVWFSTKGRKAALQGEIGSDVERLIADAASAAGIRVLELALVFDHCHMLIALSEGQSLAAVMHRLKGASSRCIRLKYPDLKLDMAYGSFWQKGYGFRPVPEDQTPRVRHYIRTQLNRPVRRQ